MVKNSILTASLRELLENEPVTGEKARGDRMRMRERVTLGLQDVSHLNQYARTSDIERIFHRSDTDQRESEVLPDTRGDYTKAHWVHSMHMVALAWRGLRLNGMDKQDIFERVIQTGIVWGEAEYLDVSRGAIESDISLNKLEAHPEKNEYDPVEKWERGLSLTGEDIQELTNRLSEHPDVDSITGEELKPLIEEYLIEDSEDSD